MIRVVLPYHLRVLAHIEGEAELDVPSPVTLGAVLAAIEARYPVLRGTIRDAQSGRRRPLVRFFAAEEDLSLAAPETPLPQSVATGEEPFWIVGAIAGG